MDKQRVEVIETPRLRLRHFPLPPVNGMRDEQWMRDLHFFADLRADSDTAKWGFEGKLQVDPAATDEWMRQRGVLSWAYIVELKTTSEAGSHALDNNGISNNEKTPKPRHTSVEGRQLLGGFAIKLPSENTAHAERLTQPMLGYTMHADARGHGYATEASKGLITAFWQRLSELKDQAGIDSGWTHIEALTDTENYPSVRVLEKCGFRYARTWEKVFFSPLLESERDCLHYNLSLPPPLEIPVTLKE